MRESRPHRRVPLDDDVAEVSNSALRVHEALTARPLLSLSQVRRRAGLSYATCSSAMRLLVSLGVAREVTGRRRSRIFVYDRYMDILNEGMEPL